MSIFYDLIFIIFAVFYFPYLLIKGKWHPGFLMRFGGFSGDLKKALSAKNNIWLHAVSVGEILSVARLIENIKAIFPFHQFVISTVTRAGFEVAQKTYPHDIVIFAPLDLSFIVRRYLRMIKPVVYIVAETEIWPNLFSALGKAAIPIIQINGRISEKAFQRYKLVKFFLKRVLCCVRIFCMQTNRDAEKIRMLGAPAERVEVIGNIKFDEVAVSPHLKKTDLKMLPEELLLIAGSTHPGEEEIVLEAYGLFLEQFKNIRLLIAPRHVERCDEIIKIIEKKGFTALRFSHIQKVNPDGKSVIIVDTMGHLKALYALADLVFVGKSLTAGGGHNIIEPAYFGKAVIVGPHTQNFQDIIDAFIQDGALVQVKDKDEFIERARDLLQNPKKRTDIGRLAKDVVDKYQGAAVRITQVVSRILSET